VIPDYHSGVIDGTGTQLKVDNGLGAELGVTYFILPQWALELSALTAPVDLGTTGGLYPGLDAGSVNLVSGLLALQYHFATARRLKPYLGIGIALTQPTGWSTTPDMTSAGISELTFTGSMRVHTQVGADLQIGKGWSLNVDLRYVPVASRVEFQMVTGSVLDTVALDINPILVGVGVARSF
jgi:outer membrane protein